MTEKTEEQVEELIGKLEENLQRNVRAFIKSHPEKRAVDIVDITETQGANGLRPACKVGTRQRMTAYDIPERVRSFEAPTIEETTIEA